MPISAFTSLQWAGAARARRAIWPDSWKARASPQSEAVQQRRPLLTSLIIGTGCKNILTLFIVSIRLHKEKSCLHYGAKGRKPSDAECASHSSRKSPGRSPSARSRFRRLVKATWKCARAGVASARAQNACFSPGACRHSLAWATRLVPGNESVGTVIRAEPSSKSARRTDGLRTGARCFGPVRGPFRWRRGPAGLAGVACRTVPEYLGEKAILFALAATALHARKPSPKKGRELICGPRWFLAACWRASASPMAGKRLVSGTRPGRKSGATGYDVSAPKWTRRQIRHDLRRQRRSGHTRHFDSAALSGGEIVLAGFYERPLVLRPFRKLSDARRVSALPPNGARSDLQRCHPPSRGRAPVAGWAHHSPRAGE